MKYRPLLAALVLALPVGVMADSPATQQSVLERMRARRAQEAATQPATTEPSANANGLLDRMRARRAAAATQSGEASAKKHYPTPNELIAKMKAQSVKEAASSKVAFFDLSNGVAEKPQGFALFGAPGGQTLQTLLERLTKVKGDASIKGVLINLGEGQISLSDAQEIRDALAAIGGAGKRVFVYADGYDTAGYTLASGATDICMLGGGEIMMPGVGFSTMFYKGLFDKVGVQADYVQIGDYKGAKEPYTNSAPSEQLRGELSHLSDSLYDQIVTGISQYRKLSPTVVSQLIDDTLEDGDTAKSQGFVDHLVDQDGLRPLMSETLQNDVELVYDYGEPERPKLDLSNPFGLLSMLARKDAPPTGPTVALIYASGVITDGEESSGLFSQGEGGVASEPMRRALRAAAKDDSIKAVVLRINSPGGSALASEVMWQAARRVAAKKPLIISVGGMAASGGYYLASSGDHIFADPAAIVGSIGVVGGKFVLKDLYAKLGLTTGEFTKGRNAGLYSSDEPFTDEQRALVTKSMHKTYEQFERRVLTTRSGKIEDIEQVAQGRIFLANQAKQNGLIDEIGGTDAALDYAAEHAGLEVGHYDVRVLPAPRTLADMLNGGGGDEAAMPFTPHVQVQVSADSILRGLSTQAAARLDEALSMVKLLQERPVVLLAPIQASIR